MSPKLLAALVLGMALTAPAAAGPVVISGSAAWADATGADFWAQPSYDGNGVAHVGVFLSGTPGSTVPGFYANSPYLSALTYLGTGATTFTWAGPMTYTAPLGVTAWVDTFAIEQGVFVFRSPTRTWRSTELDRGRSHFAVFDAPDAWYVGMEDATWRTVPTADWDYNDLVVRLPKTPVPDSGSTVWLLGVVLAALARRRRVR